MAARSENGGAGEWAGRILLVEDEEAHAHAAARSLARGYPEAEVSRVESLAEARDEIARREPDLVVMDYRLPDGDSIELLPEDGDRVAWPVLMLTSQGNEKVAVEAMRRGAMDYVVKGPDTLRSLDRRVQSVLRAWRTLQQKRTAEEAVRRSEERFRRVFEHAGEGIFVRRGDHFVMVNSSFAELFGYEREQLLDDEFDYRSLVVQQQRDRLELFIDRKDAPRSVQLLGLTRDGETRHLRVTRSLVDWEGGPAVIGFVQDQTAEVQLQKHQEQVQQMDAVRKMIITVAHEIRNPLAVLQGVADLIQMSTGDAKSVRDLVGKIPPQVQRMSRLIQRLVELRDLKEEEYALGLRYYSVSEEEGDEDPGGGQRRS